MNCGTEGHLSCTNSSPNGSTYERKRKIMRSEPKPARALHISTVQCRAVTVQTQTLYVTGRMNWFKDRQLQEQQRL